jgi:putative oxidoreductase
MRELRLFFITWAPYMLSVLRIVAALLFIEHGLQKLFAFPTPPEGAPGKPPLGSLFGVAGLIEFMGGLLFLVGLFTRPVAFLLAAEMAVAYFMVHAKQGFWPVLNKGELAALYCFVFLYFVFVGPGKISLDQVLTPYKALGLL